MVHDALTPERLDALAPAEAAAYFVMRRADGLTASEQLLLTSWLAKDEAHQQAFESADRAWGAFSDQEGNEILAAMRAHALAEQPRGMATWWPTVAAAAVLLLALGAVLLRGTDSRRPGSEAIAAIQYSSARGIVKEFQLPDGSTMALDADSAAVGRFGNSGRTVQLQRGRAFFAVRSDRTRPFTVTVGARSIVAVGTRFDVNLLADGLTVTLLDGNVEVKSLSTPSATVSMRPGQQYIERHGKAAVRSLGADYESAVTWRVGLINFDDQPLAEVVEVMNRYSQDHIVVNDPDVAAMKISGQFRAGDVQPFVATLVELHRLQTIRVGNNIELVRGQ